MSYINATGLPDDVVSVKNERSFVSRGRIWHVTYNTYRTLCGRVMSPIGRTLTTDPQERGKVCGQCVTIGFRENDIRIQTHRKGN